MRTYDYDVISQINALFNPNTVKCKNNSLYMFFCRYLWQKAVSVFEWDGFPEYWSEVYFKYVLAGAGYIAVLNTEEYGVIPQWCTFNGKRTVFYEPAGILVTNPAFQGSRTYERTLGIDAELVRMTPDYFGIGDIIGYYGDQLALTAEAIGVNTINTKTALVFASANKTAAESFKKMYDQIQSGNSAVFIDKDLYTEDGQPNWIQFIADLKNMYISPDLISTMARLEAQFDSYIGLPNLAGMEKKERMISDEVNMNNVSTYSRAELWKDNIDRSLEKVNAMFGLNIRCDWKHEPADPGDPEGQEEENERVY